MNQPEACRGTGTWPGRASGSSNPILPAAGPSGGWPCEPEPLSRLGHVPVRELFTDAWGHPTPPLKLLSACCHFAVVYRRSPVGLPWPGSVASDPRWGVALNRLLQQLAWDAVTRHPLSGVRADR